MPSIPVRETHGGISNRRNVYVFHYVCTIATVVPRRSQTIFVRRHSAKQRVIPESSAGNPASSMMGKIAGCPVLPSLNKIVQNRIRSSLALQSLNLLAHPIGVEPITF